MRKRDVNSKKIKKRGINGRTDGKYIHTANEPTAQGDVDSGRAEGRHPHPDHRRLCEPTFAAKVR